MREGKNVWKSLREYAIILCTACEKAEMEGKSQPYRQDVIRYHGGMIMTYLTAVLLGLVQGITEFLPISSSGHLVLLQNIFHIEGADLIFDVMLHVGTLFPIFLVYRRDLRRARKGLSVIGGGGAERARGSAALKEGRRLAIFLLVGTLPLLLGLLLKGTAEKLSGSSAFIGVMLLITGGVLYAAGRFSRREKSEKDISLLDVILVGLAQALAVLPGLSRSGLTISAGLLRGFPKRFAVKFSFLLSVPAVIGAALISLVEAVRLGFDVGLLPMYLAGMAAAAVSGYFAIRLLRWITSRGSIGGFAYYCWGAGIVSILLSLVA